MSLRAQILGTTSVAVLLAFSSVASASCGTSDGDTVCTGVTDISSQTLTVPSRWASFINMGGADTTVQAVQGAGYIDSDHVFVNFGIDKATFDAEFGDDEPSIEQIFHHVWTGQDNPATLTGDISSPVGTNEYFNFGNHRGNVVFGLGESLVVIARKAVTTGLVSTGDGPSSVYVFGKLDGAVSMSGSDENILLVGAIDHADPAQSALVKALVADLERMDAEGGIDDEMDDTWTWFMSGATAAAGQGVVTGDVTSAGARTTIGNLGVIRGRVAVTQGAGFVGNRGTISGGIDMSQTGGWHDKAGEVVNFGTISGGVQMGGGHSAVFNAADVGTITKNGQTYTLLDAYTYGEEQGVEHDLSLDPMVDAVFAGATATGAVGTIVGDVSGGTGALDVFNLGTIQGNVDARDLTSGLLLVNRGTITGRVLGSSTGNMYSQGIDEIINLGTIGSAAAPTGVVLGQPDATTESFFYNGARTAAFKEAYIQAAASGGEDRSKFQALLSEQQDLTKGAWVYGSVVGAGGNDAIVNFGTITGSVLAGAGNDLVANAGRINGSVDLGAGNNSFIVGVGSVVEGTVTGGGDDYLVFVGADSGYFDATKFVGFAAPVGWEALDTSSIDQEKFDKPVSGNVTLSANPGRTAFTLDDGASLGGDINGNGTPNLVLRGGGTIGGAVSGFQRLVINAPKSSETPAQNERWRLDHDVEVTEEVEVEGGELAINGTLTAPDVNVQSGGSLGGSGRIIADNVRIGGYLRPGNSIGTTTIQGDSTLTGQYVVEVNPSNDQQTFDRLVMDGAGSTLTIGNAATVLVTAETINGVQQEVGTADFTWVTVDGAEQVSFDIIGTTNGATIDGTFASVSDELDFITSGLTYGDDTVSLVLTRATTTGSVALDRLRSVGAAESAFVDTLTVADGRSHEQLGVAGSPGASSVGTNQIASAISQSMSGLRTATGAAGVNTGDAVARDRNAWVVALGATGSVDGDAAAPGFDTTVWGFSGGADAEVAGDLYAGVTAGYARSDVSADLGGETTVDSYAVGVYGTYAMGASFLEGAATYIRHQYDTGRRLGAAALSSSYGGNEFALNVGGGHAYQMGGWVVQPRADVGLSHLRRAAFTETVSGGPAGLGLTADSETFNTGRATALVDVAYPYASQGGWRVEPSIRVGVRQRFGDTSGAYAVDYAGRSNPFNVQGPEVGNTSAVAGVGLKTTGQATALFARYDGEFNAEQRNHQITGGVSFKW